LEPNEKIACQTNNPCSKTAGEKETLGTTNARGEKMPRIFGIVRQEKKGWNRGFNPDAKEKVSLDNEIG